MKTTILVIIAIITIVIWLLATWLIDSTSGIYTDRFGSYYRQLDTAGGMSLWRPVRKILFFYISIVNADDFWLDDYDFIYIKCWKSLYTEEDFAYIKQKIKEYDESSPKMDEIQFVRDICRKLNISIDRAFMLIQEVRRNG